MLEDAILAQFIVWLGGSDPGGSAFGLVGCSVSFGWFKGNAPLAGSTRFRAALINFAWEGAAALVFFGLVRGGAAFLLGNRAAGYPGGGHRRVVGR
jgi:hypothetical protein